MSSKKNKKKFFTTSVTSTTTKTTNAFTTNNVNNPVQVRTSADLRYAYGPSILEEIPLEKQKKY
jgi:hypothetical protein